MKNFIISFILVFAVWLLLNASINAEYLLSGAFVSAFLAVWSSLRFPVFKNVRMTPKSFFSFFMFMFVFLFELIKSNFDVAKRVLSPSLPINPGIISVRTKLTDPVARMLLANAITLTPGTFTIEMEGDTFFIHWIDAGIPDADQKSKDIVRKFEKYLEAVYV
jgi:multicomponent Na+:H+ antiporter subunit E